MFNLFFGFIFPKRNKYTVTTVDVFSLSILSLCILLHSHSGFNWWPFTPVFQCCCFFVSVVSLSLIHHRSYP